MRRRLLIVGAILAACGIAGGAYAASGGTGRRQAFLNDVAKRLHVSPQQLSSALQGATQDQLNAAVRAGRLTRAQADAIEKRLREGAAPLPFLHRGLLRHGGPGLVPGGPPLGLGPLGAAMQYLGITPAQLFNQLSSGDSLAAIAKAHGKSVSGLEKAIVAAQRSRLYRARQSGLISSEQEQRLLTRLEANVSLLVNHPGFRPRLRPLLGPRPFFGPRVIPPVGAPSTAPPPLS
jgi:transposase-like protein